MISQAPIRTPLRQRLSRARVGWIPLVIWILGAVGAARLWLDGAVRSTFVGLVRAEDYVVAMPVDASLDRLNVSLHQTVRMGAVLATVDDAGMNARIETAESELRRLAADLTANRAEIELAWENARRAAVADQGAALSTHSLEFPAELRAFHSDESRLSLAILETRLAITTSSLEADRIELRLARSEALLRQSAGSRGEVEDLERRIELERMRAGELEKIEADLVAEHDEARLRRLELQESYDAPPGLELAEVDLERRLAGWRAAVEVQESRLAELSVEAQAYLLRAPIAGRVASIDATPGRFMRAGTQLLTIVRSEPEAVALWVPESTALPPDAGDRFSVGSARGSSPEILATCDVWSVGPRIEEIPRRLWRDPRVAEFGRPYLIGPVTGLSVVPGERVRIDLLERID